jgi:methionyl-tRNA formyltransferase
MRIFLNGIGAFGVDTLEALRSQGDEIVAVAAPPQSLSGRADRLWAYAADAGIPVLETKRLAEPEVEAALRETAPQLGVMAFVQEFIAPSTLDLPEHGTIQYHPSLLPRHRGRSAINWAVIQGETRTGISIFWPDEGMDTGPVLLQREVEIGPDDTTGSLYRDRLYPLGIEALAEAVDLVRQGRAPKTPQDERAATYERPCGERASRIDWRRPLADVYNLVRGCDPSPGAWSMWRETKIRMLSATAISDQSVAPGVVTAVDDAGVIIGALDGTLRVKTLRVDADPAKSTQDIVAENSIVVGSAFEVGSS